MIKGAVIFGSGMAVGWVFGLIEGFSLSKQVQQVAISKATTNAVA
jgi:hypothetical protein